MILRTTVLAIVLFVGSVGVTAAQTPSDAPLGTVVKNAAGNDTAVTAVVTGWNYVHAVACTTFGGTFVLIAQDNSQWFTTDLTTIATLTPACQTGHFVAFFVINTSGTFNQVFVWPF